MLARVPASSANLGPGFDALAVALDVHVEVSVEESDHLEVHTEGEGTEFAADATHMAALVACRVAGHDRLSITVRSDIPVGRGMGSSAALAVAAAAAAGAPDPLLEGIRVDGHPENAAASAYGGLIAATMVGDRPVVRSLPLDPALCGVLLVPTRALPTREARAALPAAVALGDVVFNLGRMAILIAGLADHRYLVPEAFDDRLHQDQRAALFPEAPVLLRALHAAGALGACWSGAGPALLAVTTDEAAPAVAAAANEALACTGLDGRARITGFAPRGVTLA